MRVGFLLDLILGAAAGSGRRGFLVSLVALVVFGVAAVGFAWVVGRFL